MSNAVFGDDCLLSWQLCFTCFNPLFKSQFRSSCFLFPTLHHHVQIRMVSSPLWWGTPLLCWEYTHPAVRRDHVQVRKQETWSNLVLPIPNLQDSTVTANSNSKFTQETAAVLTFRKPCRSKWEYRLWKLCLHVGGYSYSGGSSMNFRSFPEGTCNSLEEEEVSATPCEYPW